MTNYKGKQLQDAEAIYKCLQDLMEALSHIEVKIVSLSMCFSEAQIRYETTTIHFYCLPSLSTLSNNNSINLNNNNNNLNIYLTKLIYIYYIISPSLYFPVSGSCSYQLA